MEKPPLPPAWMDSVLRAYCSEHLLEDLQGDLYEFYSRNYNNKGKFKAQLIYLLDVLKFIRLYTVKTPKFIRRMNYLSIFKNNVKTSWRSLLRNKLFSGINITGLSISMSVGLLVIALYAELQQYDQFHEKKDRIYRVYNVLEEEGTTSKFATTSVLTGDKLRDEFTGVAQVVQIANAQSMDLQYEERKISVSSKWASPSLADVFTFETLQGDLKAALEQPNSLVITEKVAKKLFGETDPMGKIVKNINEESFRVGAILADLPEKSHLKFEALRSYASYRKSNEEHRYFTGWFNMWSNYAYILLDEHATAEQVQVQLDQLAQAENKPGSSRATYPSLIQVTDIVPGPEMSNMGGPVFELKTVNTLLILALVVLLSACFNYTNLFIARALRRSKEVGIRKTIGASSSLIFSQFIIEACIVSGIALVLAVGFFFLIKPRFIEALGYSAKNLALSPDPYTILLFVVFAILTGIVAGLLPSWIMSRTNVKTALNDVSSLKIFSGISIRKGLVVLQFAISMVFIMSVIISFKQYQYMLNFDLGFQTENVLNMRLRKNDYQRVKTEFEKIPAVKDISFSAMVPSTGSSYIDWISDIHSGDSVEAWYNLIDDNYLRVMGHELIMGTNFDQAFVNSEDNQPVIVNEKFLETFGLRKEEEIIGRTLKRSRDRKLTVVGVVKNFHAGTTRNELSPFVFFKGKEKTSGEEWPDFHQVNLKIASDDIGKTLSALEKAWSGIDEVHPFSANFYEDDLKRTYSMFKTIMDIVGLLAFIAVSISVLGLLGMVIFTTETRLKEISIRKILGASEKNLLFLLGKSFLWLLLLAALIAIPFTYMGFNRYVLVDYVHRPDITVTEMVLGCLVIFVLGLVIIVSQTLQAARTNPSTMLRDE